ncbi:hypothetical protein J1605_015933 [Eschrichtius robustus]|uniref:Uncharacterized protein n=1 Tax=Eschrichtius robustus TaxID=9764 RepID=A0AB34GCH0_ESCRO|nr:hypothetical protein J1605_015933 [Eschrichtius robustus]
MNLYCEEGKVESGKEFSEQDWRHESEAEMVKHGLEMGENRYPTASTYPGVSETQAQLEELMVGGGGVYYRLKGFGYAEFEDLDSLLSALSLNEESLGNRRIRVDVADQAQDKDRMIVLLAEIEIGILTKQIQTGGPVLLQKALMTTHLEELMIALETSSEIVMIPTHIVMGIGTVIVMAHAGTWIDTGAAIAMMTEAAETMIEARIPGQAVAEEHLVVGTVGMTTTEELQR